jgi:hypothetical protein
LASMVRSASGFLLQRCALARVRPVLPSLGSEPLLLGSPVPWRTAAEHPAETLKSGGARQVATLLGKEPDRPLSFRLFRGSKAALLEAVGRQDVVATQARIAAIEPNGNEARAPEPSCAAADAKVPPRSLHRLRRPLARVVCGRGSSSARGLRTGRGVAQCAGF